MIQKVCVNDYLGDMATTTAAPVFTATPEDRSVSRHRIESIDLLRGAVMLIMAIDHCRDHFLRGHPDPTDLATTTPLLFFTRWITHFCAPVFVFLSGLSAWLAGTRRTKDQLGTLLITRGIWLIAVELLFLSVIAPLNFGYQLLVLQVIWAIGGSMLLLGVLLRLRVPRLAIGAIGVIITFSHNILDYTGAGSLGNSFVWNMLVSSTGFNFSHILHLGSNHALLTAYALLPWTGVLFLGYSIGPIYAAGFDGARRRRLLMRAGIAVLIGFVVLRGLNLYGDPSPWSVQRSGVLTVLSFFNVTKYPCSLLYLAMTLGVALVVLATTENLRSRFTSAIVVYGNVPFFYYMLHWCLIGVASIVVFYLQGYGANDIVSQDGLFNFTPPGSGLSLAGVYGIWLLVVVLLYRPCKWFSSYKKRSKKWWVSYV